MGKTVLFPGRIAMLGKENEFHLIRE